MSTSSEKSFIPEPSQGDYWGGYMLDSWLYKVLAIFPFTGFLGIDHLALRSPVTAVFKFLVNVFFWGAWYFYDIIQVMMDTTFVAKYGMSTPWGPRGHAYKLFKDLTENNLEEFPTESPYNGGLSSNILFILYALTTLVGGFTGIPNILAGDFNGGIIKLFSNFLFVPIFFYIIAQIFEFFSAPTIQKEGVGHAWPLYPMFTIFEKYPTTNLLGKDQSKQQLDAFQVKYQEPLKSQKQPLVPETVNGVFAKMYEAFTMIPPVAAFTTVQSAKGAVQATSDIAQSAAKAGQKLMGAIEKKITTNPDAVIDSFLGKATPSVPVPLEIKETVAIDNPMLKQKGGGDISYAFDTILIGGILVLVLGGFATAFLRKLVPPTKSDDEYPRKAYDRDDLPPVPGGA